MDISKLTKDTHKPFEAQKNIESKDACRNEKFISIDKPENDRLQITGILIEKITTLLKTIFYIVDRQTNAQYIELYKEQKIRIAARCINSTSFYRDLSERFRILYEDNLASQHACFRCCQYRSFQ